MKFWFKSIQKNQEICSLNWEICKRKRHKHSRNSTFILKLRIAHIKKLKSLKKLMKSLIELRTWLRLVKWKAKIIVWITTLQKNGMKSWSKKEETNFIERRSLIVPCSTWILARNKEVFKGKSILQFDQRLRYKEKSRSLAMMKLSYFVRINISCIW